MGARASWSESQVLLLAGSLLLLVAWLIARIRGEHLPTRTLMEGLALLLTGYASALAGHPPSLIPFLALLYLVVMRVRLFIDAGNFAAGLGHPRAAGRLFGIARHLAPTSPERALICVNEAILQLRAGRYHEALPPLEAAAERKDLLGRQQRAGCLYNLGVCYHKAGMDAKARACWEEALQAHPACEFGRRARRAIEEIGGKI